MNVKDVYIAGKKNIAYQKELKMKEEHRQKVIELDKKMDEIIHEKLLNRNGYPGDGPPSLLIDTKKSSDNYEFQSFSPVKLQSIETELNVSEDSSRIIKSSLGVSASQLFEYVPATKLKGLKMLL